MKTTLKRALGLAAGGGLLVGSMVMSAPAEAGGGSMVSGDTRAECNAVLRTEVDERRDAGVRIDGISWCIRDSRDGTWYGSYGHG
ncbi:hypothetical protein [Parenemella sanctibonifatiensis]|uniref:hypothetical protein n=1 Tax=Parenemella sanctibonifatiensis TaxID=2016505 RepID=UPI0015C60479|nr:hypothetical protein [Parenemella sanctibonifatiensis]